MRIAKNNLAYPLVRDTLSVLGNYKCKVLSVFDLKDAFHSVRLSENSKKYCGIPPYFGSPLYLYQRIPMGLNISSSIWHTLMQFWIVSKAENAVKQLWITYYYLPHQKTHI